MNGHHFDYQVICNKVTWKSKFPNLEYKGPGWYKHGNNTYFAEPGEGVTIRVSAYLNRDPRDRMREVLNHPQHF